MVYQGHHGDLLPEENRILLAEFYLRHRESTATIVHEYAKMKAGKIMTRLWKHPEKLSDVSANQVLDYLVHFSNRKRGEFLNHSGHPIFFKQFLYFECWLFVYHLYVVVLKMFGHSNLNYKTSEFCMKAIFSWSLTADPYQIAGKTRIQAQSLIRAVNDYAYGFQWRGLLLPKQSPVNYFCMFLLGWKLNMFLMNN